MKIHPVGTEFHADRQTGRHEELIVSCCNFAKVPKNQQDIKTHFTALTAPLHI